MKPRSSVNFHLGMMVIWGVLLVRKRLLWPHSILWVALMSLYANFVDHFSAYEAARAARLEEQERKPCE
jgi:hypothetical protein